MRIALFSDTFYPQVNGVALTLKRLVKHLEHRHVPHQVFIPKGVEDDLFKSNIHCFSSIPFFLYPECRIAVPNYLMIRNQLHQFQPDLIHIATPFNMGLCGLHYGRKFGVSHVASYHTHFDRYLNYYNLKFAAPWLWRYIRWFHESCLATLVPSNETREQLMEQGISRVELWSRGVDCHLFHPDKRNPSLREKYRISERYLFLYVGRFAPEKDIDILLEIMMNLPESLRNNAHWLLVGDGPLLPELRTQVPANVTFTGYLTGEELAEAYASADLLVFPSSTETFGNVVLESLASGTPAIGAQAGGVQEIIHNGKTGMLCPSRDGKAFVQAITKIMHNPDLLNTMGFEARKYALSQSWDAILDGLLQRYEQIASVANKSKNQWYSA